MKKYTHKELKDILGGKRVILCDADLRGMDLRGMDLRGASFSGTNFRLADLSGARLNGADLRNTCLDGVNLSGADLSGADLSCTQFGDIRWTVRPLQIFGSRDALIVLRPDEIHVGCIGLTPNKWLRKYDPIGRKNYYTEAQIREYGEHLRHAVRWLEMAEKEGWFERVVEEEREEEK